MPRFSANLSLLFADGPMPERFARAARAGFDAVEIQFPYEHDARSLADAARAARVEVVLINAPSGGRPVAGLAGLGVSARAFRETIDEARRYADALGVRLVNVLAGVPEAGDDRDACAGRLVEHLSIAARMLEADGVAVCLEALNPHDVPGYLVPDVDTARRIVGQAQAANLGLQFDIYHAARTTPDVDACLRRHIDAVRHVQFADSPGRAEPGTGDLPLAALFATLDELGYAGRVGAEYRPSRRTEDTLHWLRPDA